MKRTIGLLVLAAAFAWGATPHAHHSLDATYQPDKEIKLEGKIILFAFRNPHSFLQIEAPDATGKLQRWSLEWRGTAGLTQDGIKRDTLKVGDLVTVSGNPSRTANDHRALLTALHRKSDGFGWGTKPGQAVE